MKYSLWAPVFLWLFLAPASHAQLRNTSIDFLEVPEISEWVVSSKKLGGKKRICAPIALYNSVLLSAHYDHAFRRQEIDLEPTRLFDAILTAARKVRPEVEEKGLSLLHGLLTLGEIAPDAVAELEIQWESFVRENPEEPYDFHLRRIHRKIMKSLKNGFPPVVGIQGANTAEVKGKKVWDRSSRNLHSMTAIGIQKSIPKGENSFFLKLLEPRDAEVHTVVVFSGERRRPFYDWYSDSHDSNGNSVYRWSGDEKLKSPNLLVEVPFLRMGESSTAWWARHRVTLTEGILSVL